MWRGIFPSYSITSSACISKQLRHGEAERLRRPEVDDQLEFGGLLHRQVSRIGALQYFVHVGRGTPEHVRAVRSIGQQTSGTHEFR